MNRWQIITGAPSSGKTTVLVALQRRGYRILPEMARMMIDEGVAQGKTVAQIRGDEQRFQQEVLRRKQALVATLPPDELIFFDRGVPDTLAYNRLHGYSEAEALAAAKAARYQRVFLLERLPWVEDYARTEDEAQAAQLEQLLEATYREHGDEVIRIPVASVEERVAAILTMIN